MIPQVRMTIRSYTVPSFKMLLTVFQFRAVADVFKCFSTKLPEKVGFGWLLCSAL